MRKAKYSEEQKKASNIYSSIKSRAKDKITAHWTREDFINWYIHKEKVCCYCGCTIDELRTFYTKNDSKRKATRGNNLEIERKEDKEYTEGNCELACYWCNNAKSDVFEFKEFIPIGEAIGKVIKNKIREK